MCLITADSGILQANGAFCRMLGYSALELTELGWLGITHPADHERSVQAYQRLLRDHSSVELETRYIHKQGRTVTARLRISLVALDGTYQFAAHVAEIL
jgi:PAS domain S-box-containing protein